MGNGALPVPEGALFCRKQERKYQLPMTDNAEGYMIRFNPSLLYGDEQYFDYKFQAGFQQLLEGVTIVEPGEDALSQLTILFELLMQEYTSQRDLRREMISQFLNILMLHLFRMSKMITADRLYPCRHTLLHKFETLVEQQYKLQKKVADYAGQLFITPNYLNEIIKQATGHSAGYYIRQRVVLEAIRQARYTGENMKQIAYKLGFSDMAHFSKFFKKQSGRTFSDFRKNGSGAGLKVA